MRTASQENSTLDALTAQFVNHPLHQNPLRQNAFRDFEKLGLPGSKSEEYRFTPIARALEKIVAHDGQRSTAHGISSIDPFLIPGLEVNALVFVNGAYDEHLSRIDATGDVTHVDLLAALDQGLATTHFSKHLSTTVDPFAALNAACWQGGRFIQVPAGVKATKPLMILHLHDASKPVAGHTRLMVVLETGSSLTLLERSASVGDAATFHTFSEEIVVGENARLDYIKIQDDGGQLHQVANTAIHQSGKSEVNTFTLTLGGALIRNNFSIAIAGEHCQAKFYGLYLLRGNTLADNHTVVDHLQPNSYSNQMYKGIMDDRSKGVFNGKIFVRPHAQKTNAFQSNRNILLTDTATVNTKPQLEIWADDVKCSHGCTTGQLDEEAFFYLRSRGIPPVEARALLLFAFAGETLAAIQHEGIKNYLKELISQRLTNAG